MGRTGTGLIGRHLGNSGESVAGGIGSNWCRLVPDLVECSAHRVQSPEAYDEMHFSLAIVIDFCQVFV